MPATRRTSTSPSPSPRSVQPRRCASSPSFTPAGDLSGSPRQHPALRLLRLLLDRRGRRRARRGGGAGARRRTAGVHGAVQLRPLADVQDLGVDIALDAGLLEQDQAADLDLALELAGDLRRVGHDVRVDLRALARHQPARRLDLSTEPPEDMNVLALELPLDVAVSVDDRLVVHETSRGPRSARVTKGDSSPSPPGGVSRARFPGVPFERPPPLSGAGTRGGRRG